MIMHFIEWVRYEVNCILLYAVWGSALLSLFN